MVDYVKLAATALRLVAANGREITFIRKSEIALDPLKPWKGPISGETTFVTRGVFVPPNTVRQFGLTSLGKGTEFVDLVKFSEQIVILHQGETDLDQFTTLRDGADWNILGIQVLKPAGTAILAFVGVRR
jgi:hypothetical protein